MREVKTPPEVKASSGVFTDNVLMKRTLDTIILALKLQNMNRSNLDKTLQLVICEAQPYHVADITDIYAHEVLTGTATFELEPPTYIEMQHRFEALKAAQYPAFVALIGDRVVGYAYANAYRPRAAYRFTVENSIYIAPEFQRHGIGCQLMLRLIDTSQDQGFRQMIAVIGDGNSLGSMRLHVRMGFEKVGHLSNTGFKLGAWRDTILMQRTLGDGNNTPPTLDRL